MSLNSYKHWLNSKLIFDSMSFLYLVKNPFESLRTNTKRNEEISLKSLDEDVDMPLRASVNVK